MKTLVLIVLVSASVLSAQDDLVYLEAFGSKVNFAIPDTTIWQLTTDTGEEPEKRLILFERVPLKDSTGRDISPVIALITESISDSTDVVTYSALKRLNVPFEVTKVHGADPAFFSYTNVIGYEGIYNKEGVKHKVFVVHMGGNKVGIEIICDSTAELFAKVDQDFRDFLLSVSIE